MIINQFKAASVFLMLCFFSLAVRSQAPVSAADKQKAVEDTRSRMEGELSTRIRDMNAMNAGVEDLYKKPSFKASVWHLPPMSNENLMKAKKKLAPNSEDLQKFNDFLKLPKTGIFRLFPDGDCISKSVVRIDSICADAIPGTWFYSFRRENYSDSYFFDIRLKNGMIVGDGFLSEGILAELGDVPLENVSLASKEIIFLAGYKPETQIEAAKKQAAEITNGMVVDGARFGKVIRAEVNKTYGLRTIAYRTEDNLINRFVKQELKSDDINFLMTNTDKRADLIIVFRIVRKDSDGNLTILWKELSRQSAPKIIFPKNVNLSDIR